jgi:hypothetical protein
MATRKIPTCSKCGFQIGSYDHFMAHRGKPQMAIKGRHALGIKDHGFHAVNDAPNNTARGKLKLW